MGTWTIETLKEHYDSRFADLKDATANALAAAALATTKAEAAHEKRLDSHNQFREALADQQLTLARKSEVELMHAAMAHRVDALEQHINEKLAPIIKAQAEAGGVRVGWGLAIAMGGLVIVTAALLMTIF